MYFNNIVIEVTGQEPGIIAGLVAYYPFYGNANEETGHGYDGTVTGATLTADRYGNENSAYSFDGSEDPFLIWTVYRSALAYSGTQRRKNLRIVFERAGIKRPDGKLPRIRDFRFIFAVNSLASWYRKAMSFRPSQPFLAAYMGHVSMLCTYYYLRLAEPLTEMAATVCA